MKTYVNEHTGNSYSIDDKNYYQESDDSYIVTAFHSITRPGTFTGTFSIEPENSFTVTGSESLQGCLESIECMLYADIDEGLIDASFNWKAPKLEDN